MPESRICRRNLSQLLVINARKRFAATQNGLFLFVLLALVNTAWCQGWDKNEPLAPSVIVDFGVPHAWTMEQAHYLLERNRARDLGLAEKDPGNLDPNDTVGMRLQALSTLFSGTIQYDRSIGAKNSGAMTSFNAQMTEYNQQIAQYNQNFTQRNALIQQLLANQNNINTATKHLNDLQTASTVDQAAVTQQQAEIAQLTNANTALNAEITALNTSLASPPSAPTLTSAIPSGDETAATALGDNATFDSLLKALSPGTGATRLSASQQLDNYIDFQYEMVAKQLTLLRDEVGPDSRVVFLELPHSLYVTNKLHLYPYFGGMWGNHVVQSWWTVGGVLLAKPLVENSMEHGAHRPASMLESIELNKRFPDFFTEGSHAITQRATVEQDALEKCRELVQKASENLKAAAKDSEYLSQPIDKSEWPSGCAERDLSDAKHYYAADLKRLEEEINADNLATGLRQQQAQQAKALSESALADFFNHSGASVRDTVAQPDRTSVYFNLQPLTSGDFQHQTEDQRAFEVWATEWAYASVGKEKGTPGTATAPIYTLDLIPRQSSLNVVSAYTSNHQTGIAGLFGFLSGLGARARYERQKQEFSQFTQIETYATGFGKGDYTFGWTFAPNPGTKDIAAGLRTTYAILVVPKDARVVRLYAMGCGYRRREVPRNPFAPDAGQVREDSTADGFFFLDGPATQNKLDSEDCGRLHTFDIEVPSGDDDFWIRNAVFHPVPAGQRVTVRISGRFGDQTGVLVNGTPLQRVPAVAQPTLTQAGYSVPANAGDTGTQGVFEIVHTRDGADMIGTDLELSFSMSPTFVGTPQITIISAARDKVVNEVPVTFPDGKKGKLLDEDPAGGMFYGTPTITRLDGDDYSSNGNIVELKVVGRGFVEANDATLVINSMSLVPRKDKTAPPVTDTEFAVLPGGSMIVARLTRSKYFPQWNVDYIRSLHGQVIDTNFTRDDSTGPVVLSACTYTPGTAKDGALPIVAKLTGSFFSSANAPNVIADGSSDKVTGSSAVYKSGSEWDISASIPSTTRNVTVTVKAPTATYTRNISCETPTPGAAKKPPSAKPPVPKPKSH